MQSKITVIFSIVKLKLATDANIFIFLNTSLSKNSWMEDDSLNVIKRTHHVCVCVRVTKFNSICL